MHNIQEPQISFNYSSEDALRLCVSLLAITLAVNLIYAFISGIDVSFIFIFTQGGAALFLPIGMIVLALVGARLKMDKLSAIAGANGISLIFGVCALTLSYEIHALAMPLADAKLYAADRALGFNWEDYVNTLRHHHWLRDMLALAYTSLGWQLLIALLAVGVLRPPVETYRFVALTFLTSLIGILIASVLPSISMLEWADPTQFRPDQFPAATPKFFVEAMRAHQLDLIDPSRVGGAFNFPSFHTLGACVAIYAHRNNFLKWPAIVTNGALIFGAIAFGAHYLVDIFGGILTFFLGLGLLNAIEPSLAGKRALIAHQRDEAGEFAAVPTTAPATA